MALDILFLLPLALPTILTAGATVTFGQRNDCTLMWPDLLADSIGALPLFYLCAVMGFRRIQREWTDAARLQGLGRCGIFWRVWFPPARLWLAAGLALGLLRVALLLATLAYFSK